MLDPIVNFFTLVFQWIGRGIGFVIGIILWPFMWAARWYGQRGWMLRAVLGLIVFGIVAAYAYFFYVTQFWKDFDPDYPEAVVAGSTAPQAANTLAGDPISPPTQATATGAGQAPPRNPPPAARQRRRPLKPRRPASAPRLPR